MIGYEGHMIDKSVSLIDGTRKNLMNYDDEIRFYLAKNRSFKAELIDKNAIRLDEWPVVHSRIDIAIVNDLFVGYEIKSRNDSLEKLPKQIEDYLKVFDRLTIVLDRKHLSRAMGIIPEFVGIMLAEKGLPVERRPLQNYSIDYTSVASLLWRKELIDILEQHGVKKIRSKGREELSVIFSGYFKDKTPNYVRDAIKVRFRETDWRKPKEFIWAKYICEECGYKNCHL